MAHLQLTVVGMSCAHCKRAVESALLDLPGVVAATVDLSSGTVRVETAADVVEGMLQEAVDEAGYQLTAVTSS